VATRLLFDARGYLEGPRVHAGLLYCANTFTSSILSFDDDGAQHAVCRVPGIPCGLGFLPDGDLIVLEMTGRKLWRWSDETLSLYSDLSSIAAGTIDDMIIDSEGRAYVGDLGFDLFSKPKPEEPTGRLLLVPPGAPARVVAEQLQFPNGIAVTRAADRLAVAESSGDSVAWFAVDRAGDLALQKRTHELTEPDGICFARDGKLWVAQFRGDSFVSIDDTGQKHSTIPTPNRRSVACWLSEDERVLFCISAETNHEQLLRGQSLSRLEAITLADLAR
jgi:sugar lactone lactonase YvrE